MSQCGLQPVTANSGLPLDRGLCHVALSLWAVGFQDCDLGINRICPEVVLIELLCSCQEEFPPPLAPWETARGMIQLLVLRVQGQVGPGRSRVPLWVWEEAEA